MRRRPRRRTRARTKSFSQALSPRPLSPRPTNETSEYVGDSDLEKNAVWEEEEEEEELQPLDRAIALLRRAHSMAISIHDKEEIEWLLDVIPVKDALYIVDVDVTGADDETIDYLAQLTATNNATDEHDHGYRMSIAGKTTARSSGGSSGRHSMRQSLSLSGLAGKNFNLDITAIAALPAVFEPIMTSLTPDVLAMLDNINSTEFNVLELCTALGADALCAPYLPRPRSRGAACVAVAACVAEVKLAMRRVLTPVLFADR